MNHLTNHPTSDRLTVWPTDHLRIWPPDHLTDHLIVSASEYQQFNLWPSDPSQHSATARFKPTSSGQANVSLQSYQSHSCLLNFFFFDHLLYSGVIDKSLNRSIRVMGLCGFSPSFFFYINNLPILLLFSCYCYKNLNTGCFCYCYFKAMFLLVVVSFKVFFLILICNRFFFFFCSCYIRIRYSCRCSTNIDSMLVNFSPTVFLQ